MKATDLARQLREEDLARLANADLETARATFRAILDRWTCKESFCVFSKHQRDAIAHRAARLLHAHGAISSSSPVQRFHAQRRLRVAAALVGSRQARALRVAGSLAPAAEGRRSKRYDDREVSRALATAIHEIQMPGFAQAYAALQAEGATALRTEADGGETWERALTPFLGTFAWNARSAGASRNEAALAAMAASAVLTGHARQQGDHTLSFQLGSAAGALLRERREPGPEIRAERRLAKDIVALNDARQCVWSDVDAREARLLGVAAARAVFDRAPLRRPNTASAPPIFDAGALPEAWRERLSVLTASEAAQELRCMAADPRLDDANRALAEAASDAAEAHVGTGHVSFAQALGLEPSALRRGLLGPGRMFRAAPRGRLSARLLCRGKHGRMIRCRAVADAKGAVVGYVAFDPLSRELGGRPLFAAYGLEGKRRGYAWADEPLHWRAGVPPQEFVSAPASIPV